MSANKRLKSGSIQEMGTLPAITHSGLASGVYSRPPALGRVVSSSLAALLLVALAVAGPEPPARSVRTTVLVVKGAPGEPEYGTKFQVQFERWKQAATIAGAEMIPLAGENAGEPDRARLEKILSSAEAEGPAELWIVLIGHGTWDGKEARFNLQGPDLSATDLAAMLRPIKRPLVIINTSSSSSPFLSALAGPGRTVIAATRSGSERNYARFGEYLAAALDDPAADYDQDGRASLLECFLSASARTLEFYKKEGRIATEHALIDDNGDGKGTPADWFRGLRAARKSKDNTPLDGARAQQRFLAPDDATRQMSAEKLAARDQIETEIAALRERKTTLAEDGYYAQLEELMRRLAELYE